MDSQEPSKKTSARSLRKTILLLISLVVCFSIYLLVSWISDKEQRAINNHLQEGIQLFKLDTYAGYNEALKHYREVLKINNTHSDALARTAFICSVMVGEYGASKTLLQEGRQYIQRAIEHDQSSTMLAAAQAYLSYYSGGSRNKSIRDVEDALKENENSVVLHTTLGHLLLASGNLSDAEKNFQWGVRSGDIRAIMGLGEYFVRRSMYRDAFLVFKRVLKSNSKNAHAFLKKSVVALLMRDYFHSMSQAHANLGRFEDVIEEGNHSGDRILAEFVSACLSVRGRYNHQRGLERISDLLQKNPDNAFLSFLAAKELHGIGRHEEAKKEIEKAIKLDSSRPDFFIESADILIDLGETSIARIQLQLARELDDDCGRCDLLTGDLYKSEKNFDKAMEAYYKATKSSDYVVVARAYGMLGRVFFCLPKPDIARAIEHFEKAYQVYSSMRSLFVTEPFSLGIRAKPPEQNDAKEIYKLIHAVRDMYKRSNVIDDFGDLWFRVRFSPPGHCTLAGYCSKDTLEGKITAAELCARCIALDKYKEQSGHCRQFLEELSKSGEKKLGDRIKYCQKMNERDLSPCIRSAFRSDVKVTLGNPIIKGSIGKKDVIRVFKENIEQILFCYLRCLVLNEECRGEIRLTRNIGPIGGVSNTDPRNRDLIESCAMAINCIMWRIGSWEFPVAKDANQVSIELPIVLDH